MGYKPNKPSRCIVESYEAESDLTAGYAVIFGTAEDQVDVPGSANDACIGISLYDRSEGQKAEIVLWGPTKAIAGSGGVTKGDLCATDGNGKLVAITVGETTGDQRVVGTAMTSADTDGDGFTLWVGRNDFVAV